MSTQVRLKIRNILNVFVLPVHHTSSFTCVARCFTDSMVVDVVLHPHWRHHNSTNCWLAGLSLRGNAGDAGLTVLVAVGDVAPLREGTVAMAGGV